MEGDSTLIERFGKAQESLVLQAADLSLRTISDMVDDGSIEVSPEYQRRLRWSVKKQSELIESLLINVPIPPIYLSEDEYGTYSVIDGRQRITAIHLFLKNELILKDVEKLPELNGRRFDDLPYQLSRTLAVRPFIRSITLLKQSDSELKYEVFTRLNRGGQKLNDQEVRNAAYRGPLNDLIYELAHDDFLRERLKIHDNGSSAYKDMSDAETVLRFLTLRDKWRTFSGSLSGSMDEFMKTYQHAPAPKLREFNDAFDSAIETCKLVWGDAAFKRPVDDDSWRNQMLAGMFDAQMIAVDMLTTTQQQSAIEVSDELIEQTRVLFGDVEFEQAVRIATNTPSSVRKRITAVYQLLQALV